VAEHLGTAPRRGLIGRPRLPPGAASRHAPPRRSAPDCRPRLHCRALCALPPQKSEFAIERLEFMIVVILAVELAISGAELWHGRGGKFVKRVWASLTGSDRR